jgi:hypothetical protein
MSGRKVRLFNKDPIPTRQLCTLWILVIVSLLSNVALLVTFITIGKDGMDGIDGMDGKDGIDGMDGKDGIGGIDGINGTDGIDGMDGKDGIGGINGIDGIDGTDGTDGIDGIGFVLPDKLRVNNLIVGNLTVEQDLKTYGDVDMYGSQDIGDSVLQGSGSRRLLAHEWTSNPDHCSTCEKKFTDQNTCVNRCSSHVRLAKKGFDQVHHKCSCNK